MMENKLTIVIPCRNEEDYIGHCLQSLRTQKNIGQTQILIANNSTDDTEKVIELYKNFLNIRIIQGGTVSVARNNGARLVRTPYVCFIDGDVRFFNDFILEKTINLLEEGVLDSLEMVELITILESDYKFNYDKFEENFDSISIKNIVGFINNEKF